MSAPPRSQSDAADRSGAPPAASLDPAEVERFARLAEEWWDPHGKLAPLHAIGPARIGYVRRMAEIVLKVDQRSIRPLTGRRVLDVGCGGGLVAEPLARLGAAVTAIDPAAESIEVARRHATAQGLAIDYRADRLEALVDAGESYDLVTCLEVLEHVPEPQRFIALLAQVVRPGGLLVLSTINRTAASFALAIVGAEYVLRWLPRGTHRWSRLIQPAELDRWCEDAGLTPLGAEGVVFNPLAGTWALARDTSVNYMAAALRR